MLNEMRRLYPRGATNRGICVDADGAMLGPEWVLVRRTPRGFATLARDDAASLQKSVLGAGHDPDWLFQQTRRIADALDRGETALAQIYGLYIPVGELDDRQLQQLSPGRLAKAGFNPDEPRIPAGEPDGGEWTTGGGSATAPAVPALQYLDVPPPQSSPLVGGRWPAPAGMSSHPWFHPAQAEEDENSRRGGLLGDFMDLPREFRLQVYGGWRAGSGKSIPTTRSCGP
jgi:hypothetical protein